MRQDILFYLLLLLFVSCDNRENRKEDNNPQVKITYGSGDDFSYKKEDRTYYFAPYPFSVGHLTKDEDSMEIMVISKRLEKGDRIDIIPLAKLSLEDLSGVKQTVILATPVEADLSIMPAESFDDFIISQFSLKQIVEFWYSNRYGLQGMRVLGWSPASLEDLAA